MATPRIYYYPDPTGTLETIDLLTPLSELIVTPIVRAEEAFDGNGRASENLASIRYRVRVIIDRFQTSGIGSDALERNLLTLQRHLLAGGYIGFSRDHARTWGALVSTGGTDLARGATTVPIAGSGFSGWSASGIVSSGDEIEIERGSPYWTGETTTVSALSSTLLTPSEALRYAYPLDTGANILARWRDFWPALRLPVGERTKPIVSSDKRLNWTLDMALEYSIADALALWPAGTTWGGVTGLRDSTTPDGAGVATTTLSGFGLGGKGMASAAKGVNVDGLNRRSLGVHGSAAGSASRWRS